MLPAPSVRAVRIYAPRGLFRLLLGRIPRACLKITLILRLKNLLFILVLMPMMVPAQIFVLPQYLFASKIQITNTVMALVLPGMASTFGIFLLRGKRIRRHRAEQYRKYDSKQYHQDRIDKEVNEGKLLPHIFIIYRGP